MSWQMCVLKHHTPARNYLVVINTWSSSIPYIATLPLQFFQIQIPFISKGCSDLQVLSRTLCTSVLFSCACEILCVFSLPSASSTMPPHIILQQLYVYSPTTEAALLFPTLYCSWFSFMTPAFGLPIRSCPASEGPFLRTWRLQYEPEVASYFNCTLDYVLSECLQGPYCL